MKGLAWKHAFEKRYFNVNFNYNDAGRVYFSRISIMSGFHLRMWLWACNFTSNELRPKDFSDY